MARLSSSTIGLVAGVIYGAVYCVLAFGAAGAGHGTHIFIAPALPYGLGLLVFPVVGFLVGNLRPFKSRVLFLSVLAVHYALVVNELRVMWDGELPYTRKTWDYSPWGILLPVGFYLAGQVFVWSAFARVLLRARNGAAGPGENSPG